MNAFRKVKPNNITEAFLALVLVTLPLGFFVNSLSLALFFLSSVYIAIFKGIKGGFNTTNALLIGFYLFSICSLIWSTNTTNTKGGLIRFLSYAIIPLSFYLSNNVKIRKNYIFKTFSNTVTVFAFYCFFIGFVKALKYRDASYLYYHELSTNLSNMNAIYLSVFVSFSFLFLLNQKIKTKLERLIIIFLGLFLVLLSSKIIVVFTFLASLFYYLKNKKIKLKTYKSKVIVLLIFVVFSITSFNFLDRIKIEFDKTKINEVLQKKDFSNNYIWTGTGLRVFQIKAFTEILSEQKKYFLGSGLNTSQENLNNKYKEYKLYFGFLNYNYHNQYIQTIADLGFIGMLFLLSVFFLTIKEAFFYKDYFLLTFIFLILVVCLTESFLWRQRGMVFFVTVLLLFNIKKNKVFE